MTPSSNPTHPVGFLTIRRAAAHALCSTRTLRREISVGHLRAYLVGGKILIKPEDLKRFIEAGLIQIGGAR